MLLSKSIVAYMINCILPNCKHIDFMWRENYEYAYYENFFGDKYDIAIIRYGDLDNTYNITYSELIKLFNDKCSSEEKGVFMAMYLGSNNE